MGFLRLYKIREPERPPERTYPREDVGGYFIHIVLATVRQLAQNGEVQRALVQLFRHLLRVAAGDVVLKPWTDGL
jgi:hypothetical protein